MLLQRGSLQQLKKNQEVIAYYASLLSDESAIESFAHFLLSQSRHPSGTAEQC